MQAMPGRIGWPVVAARPQPGFGARLNVNQDLYRPEERLLVRQEAAKLQVALDKLEPSDRLAVMVHRPKNGLQSAGIVVEALKGTEGQPGKRGMESVVESPMLGRPGGPSLTAALRGQGADHPIPKFFAAIQERAALLYDRFGL